MQFSGPFPCDKAEVEKERTKITVPAESIFKLEDGNVQCSDIKGKVGKGYAYCLVTIIPKGANGYTGEARLVLGGCEQITNKVNGK